MAIRRALVLDKATGRTEELPQADTLAGSGGGGGLAISTVNLNIATMSEIFDSAVAVPGVVTANKIQTWVDGNQSSQDATDEAYVAGLSAYARVSAADEITFTIRSAAPFKGPVRLSYFIY